MSGQDIVFLVLLFGTFLYYFIISARRNSEIDSIDEYFFYGRGLDESGYERTFVATSISLATVLFFFLDYGGRFGVALIISPIMFAIGTWIFLKILPRLQSVGFLSKGSTMHNFVGQSFNSDRLRWSTAVVSMLGYLGIFIIELYVGIRIFGVISTATGWYFSIALFLMSLIFIYTYLGGFKAIVDTDRLQLILILTGSILAVLSLLFLAYHEPLANPIDLFPHPTGLPLSFAVVMVVGNVPFQILRMSHWQRAAAVQDLERVESGLKKGIWAAIGFWVLFLALGILLTDLVNVDGQRGAVALLSLLRGSYDFINYIVYPLLFVGCLAALISTADSVLISVITSYIYDFKHHDDIHDSDQDVIDSDNDNVSIGVSTARKSIIPFLLLGGALYVLLTRVLQFRFVDLLFVFYNQQLVLFPAVVLALVAPRGKAEGIASPIFYSLWLGWLIVWLVSIGSNFFEFIDLTLYASPIGWLSTILLTILFAPYKTYDLIRYQ